MNEQRKKEILDSIIKRALESPECPKYNDEDKKVFVTMVTDIFEVISKNFDKKFNSENICLICKEYLDSFSQEENLRNLIKLGKYSESMKDVEDIDEEDFIPFVKSLLASLSKKLDEYAKLAVSIDSALKKVLTEEIKLTNEELGMLLKGDLTIEKVFEATSP